MCENRENRTHCRNYKNLNRHTHLKTFSCTVCYVRKAPYLSNIVIVYNETLKSSSRVNVPLKYYSISSS